MLKCLWTAEQVNLQRGGQRVATVLMYLSNGVEGGETFFPAVSVNTTSAECPELVQWMD